MVWIFLNTQGSNSFYIFVIFNATQWQIKSKIWIVIRVDGVFEIQTRSRGMKIEDDSTEPRKFFKWNK